MYKLSLAPQIPSIDVCVCFSFVFFIIDEWRDRICAQFISILSYTNRKILLILKWSVIGWLWTKLHETLFWKVWTFKTIQSVLIYFIMQSLCGKMFWGRKRPFASQSDQLTRLIWLVRLWTYVFMVNTWPHTSHSILTQQFVLTSAHTANIQLTLG